MRNLRNAKILMALLSLTLVSSCTLKKRSKPDDPKPKVTIDNPAPTPEGANAPQRPFAGTAGKIDPQIQIDFDEYNNPSLSEEEEDYDGGSEPGVTGKKRFTGYTNDSGFAYTDASTDFLVPYLRTVHNESSDSHAKRLSVDFAKKIKDVKILSSTGGQFTVRVRYEVQKNRTATVKLTGTKKMGGRYALLSENSGGTVKRLPVENWADQSQQPPVVQQPSATPSPTATPAPFKPPTQKPVDSPVQNPKQKAPKVGKPVEKPRKPSRPKVSDSGMIGELRCVDLAYKGKCSHYLLRLILNSREGEAVAEVVIRRSTATLRIAPPRTETQDPRARMLRDILYNSSLRNPQGPHFTTFDMQSWAVVNGRSEFQVHIQTDQGEHLYFTGPLLTAFGSEPINVLLKRNPNQAESTNARWMSTKSGFITSMIDSARLVSNNGRGSIKIDLIIADHRTQEPIAFGLTFTRMLIPILDLTQDSIYFNP